jgi:hypothetical protein
MNATTRKKMDAIGLRVVEAECATRDACVTLAAIRRRLLQMIDEEIGPARVEQLAELVTFIDGTN